MSSERSWASPPTRSMTGRAPSPVTTAVTSLLFAAKNACTPRTPPMITSVMRVPMTKLRSRSFTTISRVMTIGQIACPLVRGASGATSVSGVRIVVVMPGPPRSVGAERRTSWGGSCRHLPVDLAETGHDRAELADRTAAQRLAQDAVGRVSGDQLEDGDRAVDVHDGNAGDVADPPRVRGTAGGSGGHHESVQGP